MHFRDEPSCGGLVDELNELIARHRAAIDVCDEAASRITDLGQRVLVRELITHHIREVDELSRWVSELGARPSREVRPFRRDRTEVQQLCDDDSLVRAVLVEEELLAETYRRVTGSHADRRDVAAVLKRIGIQQGRERSGLTRRLAAGTAG